MLEQLNGPVGIGAAVIAMVVLLALLRKIMTVIFLVLAVGFGGWAVARQQGWDIPFVLPGLPEAFAEAAAAPGAAPEPVAEPAMAEVESAPARMTRSATRSLGAPAAAAPSGPSPADAAASVADGVRTAELKYNAPTTMQLNMPVDLRLAIDTSGMADLDAVLEGLPGEIRGGEANLTSQVTASLSGNGFDIRALKPTRQILSETGETTWQWEVTPRNEGMHTLILEVFAHPGDGDAAARVSEFRDEIEVQVTLISKALIFAQTAQPAVGFAAGGVSLLMAFFGLMRRRRRR